MSTFSNVSENGSVQKTMEGFLLIKGTPCAPEHSFIPLEIATPVQQVKIISVGGRSLQTNCLKVKNTPATGTGGPSYEETSQKPFMSLPTELHQEEEPQKNDAMK